MTGRLTDMVEQITGRKVATYQSQVMFDPDVIVEMFVFDQPGSEDAREATAGGQLREDGTGETTTGGALEAPSDAGQ